MVKSNERLRNTNDPPIVVANAELKELHSPSIQANHSTDTILHHQPKGLHLKLPFQWGI